MAASDLLQWFSMGGSALSIVVGISYLIYGFTKLNFAYDNCDFFYCNTQWRTLVSFSPDVFMDTFQPIVLGLIGVIYALPSDVRPMYPRFMSPPSSSVLGGIFHIVMALFANIGYMYWFGIAVAAYNILTGLAIVIVSMMETKDRIGSRPKDIDEMPVTNAPSMGEASEMKAQNPVIV